VRDGKPFLVVLVTAPPGGPAENLARSLVEGGIAACVTRIANVRSTYRWAGKIEEEAEDLLIIKTDRGRLDRLEEHVRTHHPYEVPEILALPIDSGSGPYLAWLAGSVGDS
jgi:periplasmic divalent cation tolerance protein